VATSRKVSRSVSLRRTQDDVNSLSNVMRGRVSTYLSRLPTESQNRWQAPFHLGFFHTAIRECDSGSRMTCPILKLH